MWLKAKIQKPMPSDGIRVLKIKSISRLEVQGKKTPRRPKGRHRAIVSVIRIIDVPIVVARVSWKTHPHM